MKLTKLQRFTAYCIMREEAERPSIVMSGGGPQKSNNNGLCFMITHLFDIYAYDHSVLKFQLPELYRNSKVPGCFFFDSWEERITALDECIAETSPDTTQSPNR